MEVNDLMVGDWMQFANGVQKVMVVGIKMDARYREKDPIITVENNRYRWIDKSLDELKPVLLTAEILESNGFIKDKDEETGTTYHLLVPTGHERNSFTIQVSIYKKPICGVNKLVKCWGWIPPQNGGVNDIHLCSADYVHQLQHAMRLCGINKKIIIKEN